MFSDFHKTAEQFSKLLMGDEDEQTDAPIESVADAGSSWGWALPSLPVWDTATEQAGSASPPAPQTQAAGDGDAQLAMRTEPAMQDPEGSKVAVTAHAAPKVCARLGVCCADSDVQWRKPVPAQSVQVAKGYTTHFCHCTHIPAAGWTVFELRWAYVAIARPGARRHGAGEKESEEGETRCAQAQ